MGMDASRATEPELVDVESRTTAVIGDAIAADELVAFFDRSFSTIANVVSGQGIAVKSPAFALYHGPPAETVDLEVGFVTDRHVQPDGEVRPGSLPTGRVARLVHQGGYDRLRDSWERLRSWTDAQGLVRGGALWEVYVTEPSPDMDPATLVTELNWLLED
jgi:effector-binding domain-containing protein